MKFNKLTILVVLSFFCSMNYVFAQEEMEEKEVETEEEMNRHQIGVMIGHVHISNGVKPDGKKWDALPMFSINYNYRVTENWSLGLHTDFVNETFEVEEHLGSGEEKILERERPIAPALMVGYKPREHFTYMLGAGGEFAKEEDLFLLRAEVEYSLELPNEFEFAASIGYDFRFNAYDSLAIALGVLKSF